MTVGSKTHFRYYNESDWPRVGAGWSTSELVNDPDWDWGRDVQPGGGAVAVVPAGPVAIGCPVLALGGYMLGIILRALVLISGKC